MTRPPLIAVLGASVRAAAFSLLRAGYSVAAADLFADADLCRACLAERVINYPDDLANWLESTACDGWLYTGAMENYPELIDRMAEMRPLWGNPGSVVRAVRNPLSLQATLRAAGLRFPETLVCTGKLPGQSAWLHKTGLGGNGSGVHEADLSQLPSGGYWQRFIPGVAGSLVVLESGNEKKIWGITRQLVGEAWTGASRFQYCGTLVPWVLPEPAITQLERLAEVLTCKFQLRGPYGIDFIFDGSEVWPLEVNPRTTAAVEIVERSLTTQLPAGKVTLYAKHAIEVSQTTSESLLMRAGSFEQPRFADIPCSGTIINRGEPILTLFADGESLEDVDAQLRDLAANLELELYGNLVQ